MKKFCIQSLIMGIGIGMIITASFNFLWDAKNAASLTPNHEVTASSGLEQSIEDLKNNLNDGKKNEDDGIEEENFVENRDDDINDDGDINDEESMARIIISSGMNTNSIANLLWAEGLISDPDDFIQLAHEKNYTRKFIAGRKLIPIGSTIDEILEILIIR